MSIGNNDLNVKFGADIAQLKNEMQQAFDSVHNAINGIKQEFATTAIATTQSTQTMSNSVEKMKNDTQKSINGLQGAFAGIKNIFAGLAAGFSVAAIVTAAKSLAEVSDKYTELEGRLRLVTSSEKELKAVENELYNVSQRTRVGYGETTDLYTRLARSTENVNISQTELLKITESINKALIVSGAKGESANAALMQLGQGMASGTLRGEELNSVLEQAPRLAKMIADGMDITVGELRKYGQDGKLSVEEVTKALLSQGEVVDKEFAKMPMTVGQSIALMKNAFERIVFEISNVSGATSGMSASFSDFAAWVDRNRQKIVGTISLIVSGFMELVSVVGEVLSEAFGLIGDFISYVAKSFGVDTTKILGDSGNKWADFASVIAKVGAWIKQRIADTVTAIRLLGNAFVTLNDVARKTILFGGEGNPIDAFKAGVERQKAILAEHAKDIAEIDANLKDRLNKIYAKPNDESFSDDKKKKPQPKDDKNGDKSEMGGFELGLEKQKAEHAMSLEAEKAYWQQILNTHKLSAKDREAVERKIAQKQIEINKQKQKDEEELINTKEAKEIAALQEKEDALAQEYELEQISQKDYLAALRALEKQRFDIEEQAQQERIKLAERDPARPENVQKEQTKALQIHQQGLKRLTDITTQQLTEQRKQWDTLFKGISDGVGKAVGGFVFGTQSLRTALGNIFQSIQQSFANMLGDMVTKWIEGQLKMLLVKETSDAAKAASTATASATETAVTVASAQTQVAANAAKAGSGAAASQASIPFAGPALAVAAFAATIAMVLGAQKLFSAEGGFDIPAGVNPLTQLHSEEMVLPSPEANVIRDMADKNKNGKEKSIRNGDIHLHVSAMDAQSVKRFLNSNGSAIADALKTQVRNFKR